MHPKWGGEAGEGDPREMPEETLCKVANLSETVRACGVGVTLGTARGEMQALPANPYAKPMRR